jgi:hypothetical protein
MTTANCFAKRADSRSLVYCCRITARNSNVHHTKFPDFFSALVSRIYGLILVPGAARACDIGLFPSLGRYGIRKIVWSLLEFCC